MTRTTPSATTTATASQTTNMIATRLDDAVSAADAPKAFVDCMGRIAGSRDGDPSRFPRSSLGRAITQSARASARSSRPAKRVVGRVEGAEGRLWTRPEVLKSDRRQMQMPDCVLTNRPHDGQRGCAIDPTLRRPTLAVSRVAARPRRQLPGPPSRAPRRRRYEAMRMEARGLRPRRAP